MENPFGVEKLETPDTHQLANILAGLGRMTPLLCQSVSTIAFGDFGSTTLGMVNTYLLGDIMMVNSGVYTEAVLTPGHAQEPFRRMDLQQTILHEAGHAVEALLNSEGLGLDQILADGNWSPTARMMANETIDRVRLKSGFGEEWSRVHDSFVEMGWATDYVDSPAFWSLSQAQIANSGFMSPYGASGHADDIAEVIGWTYIGSDYASAGVANRRRDFACLQMAQHTQKDLPADLAAIYTKLCVCIKRAVSIGDEVADSQAAIPLSAKGFVQMPVGCAVHLDAMGFP